MSATDPELGPSAAVDPGAEVDNGVVGTLDERDHRSRSSWPITRPPGIAMTLLVGVAVAIPDVLHDLGSALFGALVLPALLATLTARLVYESIDGATARSGVRAHLLGALGGSAGAAAVMVVVVLILGMPASLALSLASFALGSLALLGAGLIRDLEIRVRLSLRRVFFAGSSDSLRELCRELARSSEASLVGIASAHPTLGPVALADAIIGTRATVLVLDHDASASPTVVAAASELGTRGVRVRDLLTYYESEFKKVPLTELTPAWFLFERDDAHRTAFSDAARRATMMLAGGAMLVATLPLLAALAAAVRVTSPGPAIFRQTRVGKDGAHFTLLKLRTMTVAGGPGTAGGDAVWATDEAHRITPLGRLLRRYRLDELPQLWNVLRGDLALIGPRPEQVPIVERLTHEIPFYSARHSVRPGLTGWAQVNLGYAGSLEGSRAKLQRDLYYVKHRSLGLDLLILWLTLEAVFTDPR